MVNKVELIIPKLSLNLIPNIEDMKIFASNYTKDEWKILTNNRSFLNIFTENLDDAKKIATNLLYPELENKQENKNSGNDDKNTEKSTK